MSRGRNGAAGGAKGARRATVAAAAAVRGGKGRWSARRKMTVVLELLRGATGDEPQVPRLPDRLAGGVSRGRGRIEDPSHRCRRPHVVAVTTWRGQRGAAGTDSADGEGKAFSTVEVEAMSRTESPSTAKPYEAVWGLTYYARRHD